MFKLITPCEIINKILLGTKIEKKLNHENITQKTKSREKEQKPGGENETTQLW